MKMFKTQIYNLIKKSTKLLYVFFVCRKKLRGQDDAGFAAHPRFMLTPLSTGSSLEARASSETVKPRGGR